MATKAAYTEEQTKAIISAMSGVKSREEQEKVISDLCVKLGKTLRQMTAKVSMLSRTEKNVPFFAKTYEKKGISAEDKGALVGNIAELVGETAESFDSLEKANKAILVKLETALLHKQQAEAKLTAYQEIFGELETGNFGLEFAGAGNLTENSDKSGD